MHRFTDTVNSRLRAATVRERVFYLTISLLCILVGLPTLTGCAENDQKKWDDFWGMKNDGSGGGISLLGRRPGDSEIWTIECNEYKGENRHDLADNMATALKRVDDLKGREIWVQHDEELSRIYCGEYKLAYVAGKKEAATDAPSEPQIELNDAIKRDLKYIRALAVGDKFPFFSARVTPKPLPNAGPPEWDLRNARGVYTLNVGVTYNTPTLHNYKEAAVEWVKDLRDRGFQAYYYHDTVKPVTSICVGTFGEDAATRGPDGVTRYSPAVHELRNKEEFKYNLENGAITYRSATGKDGKRARMANESFLVKIPKKPDASAAGQP